MRGDLAGRPSDRAAVTPLRGPSVPAPSLGLPRRSAGTEEWPEDAPGLSSRSLASGGLLPEDLTDEELTPEDLVVLRDHERAYIRRAYQTCNKNLTRTAQVLGISVNTLKKKLKGK